MQYVESAEYRRAVDGRFQELTGKANRAGDLIIDLYPEVTIYLYGSLARQELKPDSDIDLLVVKSNPQEIHFDEIRLMMELQTAQCGWPDGIDVNILDLNKPHDRDFFTNVFRRSGAVLIYQNDQTNLPWQKS